MPWVKGQSGNPKGSPKGGNPNAGRPPDWFIQKCRTIVDKIKLAEFLGSVAAGEDVEQVVTDKGEVLRVPAPVTSRLKAAEMLVNYAHLAPKEYMPVSANVIQSVINAESALKLLKEIELNAELVRDPRE